MGMGRAWVLDGRAAQCSRASTRKRKNKWLAARCALRESQRASARTERARGGRERASERAHCPSERESARRRSRLLAKSPMASCAHKHLTPPAHRKPPARGARAGARMQGPRGKGGIGTQTSEYGAWEGLGSSTVARRNVPARAPNQHNPKTHTCRCSPDVSISPPSEAQ